MNEIFNADHLKFKRYFGFFLISLTSFILILIFWTLFLTPKVKATTPKTNAIDGSLKKIEINFNKPVNRSKISTTITPDVSGTWQYENQILGSHLFTKLVFYPEQYLTPEQSYSVQINNISSILNTTSSINYDFNFTAQPLPKIKALNIVNNQKDVEINTPIIIELNQANDNIVDYEFIFSPEVNYKKSYSTKNNQYILELNAPLNQSTEYTMVAKRILINGDQNKNAEIKDDYLIKFTTKKPPGVKSYYPSGSNIHVDTTEFGIIFDQDMDQSSLISNVSISPIIKGKWDWDQKNSKFVFTVGEKLTYSTGYAIHINKGTKGIGNNYLSDDINLTFNTIGNIKIISTLPKNKSTGITLNTIGLTFDQEVDHASAEKYFYLEPSVNGSFSWKNNSMTFTTSGLSNDTTYKFGVGIGIASIYGLPSISSFDYLFTTKSSETILNIALDYQDKPLSCEAASLKMALRYKGVNVSETDIMNIVGYDPTIRNGNVWGDPYTAFVGDINGHQDTTGYGVYWNPIAKAANTWRSATAFTGWTVSQAAEQIAGGNPVVIWGVTGSSIVRDDWYTPSEKNILAWHGEHARTLIGFKGSVANPTSFIINDPISGRITWTKSQFESNWSAFNNAGVVVY